MASLATVAKEIEGEERVKFERNHKRRHGVDQDGARRSLVRDRDLPESYQDQYTAARWAGWIEGSAGRELAARKNANK